MLTPITFIATLTVLAIVGFLTRDKLIERFAPKQTKQQLFTYVLASTALSALGLIVSYVATLGSAPWAITLTGVVHCVLAFNFGYVLAGLGHWTPYTK